MGKSDRGERDERGRFVIGNPGGPGRPRREVEADYLKLTANVVTPKAWERIVRAALERAEGGDLKAAQWLSTLLLGANPPTLSDIAAGEMAGVDTTEHKAARLLGEAKTDALIHGAELREIRR